MFIVSYRACQPKTDTLTLMKGKSVVLCLGKTAGDLAKERNKVEVSRRIEQVGGEQGRNIARVFGCGGHRWFF